MKDRTFIILLLLITVTGVAVSVALTVYGFRLWQSISIVEMIANWR